MASKPQVNGAPKMNGVATKKAAPSRAPVKRATPKPAQKARPVQNKAASVAGGDNYANGDLHTMPLLACVEGVRGLEVGLIDFPTRYVLL